MYRTGCGCMLSCGVMIAAHTRAGNGTQPHKQGNIATQGTCRECLQAMIVQEQSLQTCESNCPGRVCCIIIYTDCMWLHAWCLYISAVLRMQSVKAKTIVLIIEVPCGHNCVYTLRLRCSVCSLIIHEL